MTELLGGVAGGAVLALAALAAALVLALKLGKARLARERALARAADENRLHSATHAELEQRDADVAALEKVSAQKDARIATLEEVAHEVIERMEKMDPAAAAEYARRARHDSVLGTAEGDRGADADRE